MRWVKSPEAESIEGRESDSPKATYEWSRRGHLNLGLLNYQRRHKEELEVEGGRKSRDIAVDGITRAAGPY